MRDGFYHTMAQPFQAHPEIGAAFCRQIIINEDSKQVHVSYPIEPDSGISKTGWSALRQEICCKLRLWLCADRYTK